MKEQQLPPSSFGNLLKTYRKRKGITQKQLAQRLGVHANTVSAWELGTYLPNSRGLVLELARSLTLDEAETRQILEASLTALSPRWLIPLPRNPFFTGRGEILASLHACLYAQQVVALTQSYALHGLGGVGKTQIALEYAYRHALEYSAIFWIAAESVENIITSLLAIAELLNLPERQEAEQQRIVTAVQRWLSTHSHWLLIWDNVEDLELLQRFLPAARQGVVLITTRCQALGTLAQGLELSPMEREEGMLFVLKRAKALGPEAGARQMQQLAVSLPTEYAAAEKLVNAMGGLPLALDQAGAYIEETGCSLLDYLHRYEHRHHQLLGRRGAFALDHPQSVITTLGLACQRVAERCPAALELLRFCAFVAPDAIPEELFVAGAAHLGPVLGPVAADATQFDEAIAALRRFSLMQRQPETQTLSLHRLVQAVLREQMTEAEREQWNGRAIEALDATFPETLPNTAYTVWERCDRLLPHALLCLHRAEFIEESLALASLAYKTAQYFRERGQYAEAESLFQQALHIYEQSRGPEHPDLARPLNYLAVIYRRQGRYAEAEPLLQRALHLREQSRGPEHPDIASTLNNLASLYWMQGKYAEAETCFRRAWFIYERVGGPEHPDLGNTFNNLAVLYMDQGRYAEAEPLLQQALHIWEQRLGTDHPLVAYSLTNLALLYLDQGKDVQAAPLLQRALHLRERVQGPEHPDVAQVLNSLAILFQMQGQPAQAILHYQRALRIWEQALGPDHPQLADPLTGLANVYRDQGKYEQAEPLLQRALSILERHHGLPHPATAQTLHDLAILRQKQGSINEALSFAERALAIRSQFMGDTHPKTIATRALYAQLVEKQGRTEAKTKDQS